MEDGLAALATHSGVNPRCDLFKPNQAGPLANRMASLKRWSDRELEVFQLIGQGRAMKEIGAALHLSPKTIEVHRAPLREKLRVTSAAELVACAAR